MLGRLAALRPDVEICLCDTTGRATPDHVAQLSAAAAACCPQVSTWAYHAHDTYGLGLATTYAAYREGVRVFDAAAGGLGGCPFAPGATGNVATEDVVWMFHRMGVATGIDLDALLAVARDAAALPGASPGGRDRDALGDRLGAAACATGGDRAVRRARRCRSVSGAGRGSQSVASRDELRAVPCRVRPYVCELVAPLLDDAPSIGPRGRVCGADLHHPA